jgi:hypothetical protein
VSLCNETEIWVDIVADTDPSIVFIPSRES